MAIPNERKKMIIFSSIEKRTVLEGIIQDIASTSGHSESSIIEQALAAHLMPSGRLAAHWVEQLYNEKISVAEAYEQVCTMLANPMEHTTLLQSDAVPLLNALSHAFAENIYFFTGKEEEIPAIQRNLRAICDVIQDEQDKKLCEEYTELLNSCPVYINPLFIVHLLTRNWELVKHRMDTFDTLLQLIRSCSSEFPNTATARNEFVAVVKALFPKDECNERNTAL